MSIEFQGLSDVLNSLDEVADIRELRAGIQKACILVERSAKQKAPKGITGELARSITHKVAGDTGEVFTPLEYAPYVEYGTGKHAENGGRSDVPWVYFDERENEFRTTYGQHPQPFMRPALEENRQEIIRIIKEGIIK